VTKCGKLHKRTKPGEKEYCRSLSYFVQYTPTLPTYLHYVCAIPPYHESSSTSTTTALKDSPNRKGTSRNLACAFGLS